MSAPRGSKPVSAFDRATRLLGVRAHFRADLRRKLIQKGHDEVEADDAISRLARLGYLDDESLAVGEAQRLRASRRLGRGGLAAELRRKGAPDEAIEHVLADLDGEDEATLAGEAARRWLASHRANGAALARHLDRKGFARRVIFRVLNDLLPDAETPPEVD